MCCHLRVMDGPDLKSLAISLLSNCHTCDCPVYALQNGLQGGSTIPKLEYTHQTGHQFGSIVIKFPQYIPDLESYHWASLSSILCFI
ncbi:hypothetical protein ACHAXS_001781 [Conticribra weissflogii]